jgi:hypothetical protein
METLAMIRQVFWGRKHEPYVEVQTSRRPKKARQVKIKVKSTLIIFLTSGG